jgi:hypothetical protein
MAFSVPRELAELLDSGEYILFLGAGVAVEAGIPTWSRALSALAQRLQHVPDSGHYAGLMFQEAQAGRYLEAAELLYLAPISPAARADLLRAVFDTTPVISRKLKLLVSARCQGIVTTNFDRSLELAATQARVELVHYTEAALDLANARVAQVRYLLRLHGRIEVPDSLVLAHRHFNALAENAAYVEFFRNLILNLNIIFFGFSFSDPILNTLLRGMGRAVKSVFRRRAFALLPEGPVTEVDSVLRELAIQVVRYPRAENHAAAWDLFAEHRSESPTIRPEVYETESLRSHLASVYARVKAREFSADRARVLSGLMIPVLVRVTSDSDVAVDEFLSAVEQTLALPDGIGRELLMEAVSLLERDGIVHLRGTRLRRGVLPSLDALDLDANRLLRGIVHRSSMRFGTQLSHGLVPRVRDALVFALSLDGLHLAYSIIRGTPLDKTRLRSVIDLALSHAGIRSDDSCRPMIGAAVEDLMTQPDAEEERVLANVSVVVFATALLLADPTAAQVAARQFDAGAYVDASVLLPWICHGHPLQQSYAAVIAAFGAGRIRILDGYLNEVVSHRRLAVQAMNEGLRDAVQLGRYVSLFELHNVNTFVGGYAAAAHGGFAGGFEDYLATYAPFDTDQGAAEFIRRKGILVEDAVRRPNSVYGQLRGELRELGRVRSDVVVEHDARQLEVLASPKGADMVFVTADRKLVAAASRTNVASVVRRMLLPHQAAYLAQFAARGRAGFEGIVRAMWAQSDDVATKVRRFYADRILKEYEAALAQEIPAILDAMFGEFERAGIDISAEVAKGEGEGERLRVFAALDRFEPQFYEKLAEAKRRVGLE